MVQMRRDDSGQMLTIEATIAALILLSAVFFLTQFTPTETVDHGTDLSRIQLQTYGQDIMTMITTKNIVPEIGYKLRFYREWNSTEDDGMEKWEWEENGTLDGTGTEVDVSDPVYVGVDEEWTDDHLVINHSESENETIWFVLKPRGASLRKPTTRGDLKRITPFISSSIKVETVSADKWRFNTTLYDQRKSPYNYGSSMVWLQTDSNDVTNPLIIWQNAAPSNHDEIVTINESSTNNGELNTYWQLVRLEDHNSVFVDVEGGNNKNRFHVLGPGIEDGTSGEATENGVSITYHGEIGSSGIYRWEVEFTETSDGVSALGGYSIHYGPGSSFQWSDPVFVIVGKSPTIQRQISPFDNILNPLELNYFEREFVPFMKDVTPRNMDYTFVVYRPIEGGGEEVVYNSEGDRLAINENRTPVDPIVVNRYIASSNGSRTDVYNARLTLWYK